MLGCATRYQRVIVLLGPEAKDKGVFLSVIEAVVTRSITAKKSRSHRWELHRRWEFLR